MLKISKISFPGLGIGEFSVNSVAFTIGNVTIAWYAILITLGMIAAVAYTIYRAKQVNIKPDVILDFALAAIPLGIIGARLYYVFTKLDEFSSFGEVLNIRGGGLAIYGGIIGGAIGVILVAVLKKINFFAIADCCTPGIILAQAIGRWGNFMNGEAFGYQTSIFIRMGLQNGNSFSTFGTADMVYVHPTFLYESLWNLLGFALINVFYRHRKYDGQVFLMVFGWYGLGRMFIEGLRTDSLYTGSFRTSQVLAGVIFVVTLALLIVLAVKKYSKPMYRMESVAATEAPTSSFFDIFKKKNTASSEKTDNDTKEKSKNEENNK